MTDPIHEQLSAFLDGELSAAESELLLKRVARDPDLKVRLERYVLAGEALRATDVQARPSRDFSARIAAAIDNESAPGGARRRAAQWLKPIAGGAIAAGVAAMALVSFQVTPMLATQNAAVPEALNPDPPESIAASLPATQSQMVSQAGSASYTVPDQQRRVTPAIQVVNNGRLANFVVAHSEYSSPLGRRNVLMGLVAEEAPAEQSLEPFVESYIAEQLALDESTLPPPVPPTQPSQSNDASRGMLSRSPR